MWLTTKKIETDCTLLVFEKLENKIQNTKAKHMDMQIES